MSLPVIIRSGTGAIRDAHVTEEHALLVASQATDGFELSDSSLTRYKLFRTFLKNSAGSIEMNINGSVTPMEFTVTSEPGKILYISIMRFIINGTYFEMNTQDFRRFGAATVGGGSLTNGITLVAFQGGVQTSLFAYPIRQSGDFFDYADDFINLTNAVSAQSDFLSFDMHFLQPVVLPEAVEDRMVLTIRDNLTSVDQFRCLIRGWQESK